MCYMYKWGSALAGRLLAPRALVKLLRERRPVRPASRYAGGGQVLRVVWTPRFTADPVGLHGM